MRGDLYFGECKWSSKTPVGMDVYARLLSKVERLPEARHRKESVYILFSVGGFTKEVTAFAASLDSRLHLVGPEALLPIHHSRAGSQAKTMGGKQRPTEY